MPTIQISFHEDPVVIPDLCADLLSCGCVYWHTTKSNFRSVADRIDAIGIEAISLCAHLDDDFLYFFVRTDLATDVSAIEARAARAISEWLALGEPIPHIRSI